MKAKQLQKLGIPTGDLARATKWQAQIARQDGLSADEVKSRIKAMVENPAAFRDDPYFGSIAKMIAIHQQAQVNTAEPTERTEAVPCEIWGEDLEEQAMQQMQVARRLPVAERAALMPDAHLGYGLPIGGVLATQNAVIPYAVGVDIACRMKLTVLDLPTQTLQDRPDLLTAAIESETRFGMGAQFENDKLRDHDVMDADWSVSPITSANKDKAHRQLGTSGSGNHFVEFGTLTLEQPDIGLEPGTYLALLSHSGSRGTGAQVCKHYSELAMMLHPKLPKQMQHLAWLDMDSYEGQEYWQAMQLMGEYAAANHAMIHKHIVGFLGAEVLADVENHHNFAWLEEHDGKQVVVHRKGATPAGKDVLGIIPGSMASPGYVVRGKGNEASLRSASHGAGRVMSRRKARQTYNWAEVRDHLQKQGVTVISAGLDEVPFVYKKIDRVMAQQVDLVDVIARFDPRLVKMAPDGEKPED